MNKGFHRVISVFSLLLLCSVLISSCSIYKRHYLPGYSFQIKGKLENYNPITIDNSNIAKNGKKQLWNYFPAEIKKGKQEAELNSLTVSSEREISLPKEKPVLYKKDEIATSPVWQVARPEVFLKRPDKPKKLLREGVGEIYVLLLKLLAFILGLLLSIWALKKLWENSRIFRIIVLTIGALIFGTMVIGMIFF